MHKRLFSLILCLCLLASLILPDAATETAEAEIIEPTRYEIADLAQFLTFAEAYRLDSFSVNTEVTLSADIDLTGTDFGGIPTFSGTFLGNGHTISGLEITAEGSYLGLFRYLTETAVVQDLKIIGNIAPLGSRSTVGGIAGSNAGTIRNCHFDGSISGNDTVGGIAGRNTLTGIIENCTVSGAVHGGHFAGGIAGSNAGVIRSCENSAAINITSQQNTVDIAVITLDSLTGTESAGTVTDVGGIAGNSSGVIRSCKNFGNVGYKHMGYNIGGIAGTQSGYLAECENYGAVSGRKEVGGIVGQLEPAALVDFDEDALQILQGQLDAMRGVTNQTAANLRGSASQITGQVESLQSSIDSARDAVDSLIPDPENPELPDADSLQAAQNALSESLKNMQKDMEGISATTNTALGTLSNNLYTLQDQLQTMSDTVGNMSGTLGGSLEDVSDLDTEADLSCKVALCQNYGPVLGDMNVGGIAGIVAVETDLDWREDVDILGQQSYNFVSRMRAVILSSSNNAPITATKQNAGGVAGWVSMGLVKDCANSGDVNAEGAAYVGGIAGQSTGFLRGNSAKCILSGDMYVGGIAGSGTVVTDCRSMVQLTASEQFGSLLGKAAEDHSGMENPVSGNYYLAMGTDPGAIDGISYSGIAERLEQENFLALENLSDIFHAVTLTFRYEDGTQSSYVTLPGSNLNYFDVPQLPEKAGYTALWEGLADAQAQPIYFDKTFQAVYIPRESTLESSECAENGKPLLLLTGSFGTDAELILTQSDAAPTLKKGDLLQTVSFLAPESQNPIHGRYLLPEGCEADHLQLLVLTESGSWEETPFTVSGSYVVFPARSGENTLVLVQEAPSLLPYIGIGVGVVALAALLLTLKKKKT